MKTKKLKFIIIIIVVIIIITSTSLIIYMVNKGPNSRYLTKAEDEDVEYTILDDTPEQEYEHYKEADYIYELTLETNDERLNGFEDGDRLTVLNLTTDAKHIKFENTLQNLKNVSIHGKNLESVDFSEIEGSIQNITIESNNKLSQIDIIGTTYLCDISFNGPKDTDYTFLTKYDDLFIFEVHVNGKKTINLETIPEHIKGLIIHGDDKTVDIPEIILPKHQLTLFKYSNSSLSEVPNSNDFHNIDELNFTNNNISTIKSLEDFENVRGINLTKNPIKRIENIETAPETLSALRFEYGQVTEITQESYDHIIENDMNISFWEDNGRSYYLDYLIETGEIKII